MPETIGLIGVRLMGQAFSHHLLQAGGTPKDEGGRMKDVRRGAEQGPACGMRPPVAHMAADVNGWNCDGISEAARALGAQRQVLPFRYRPVRAWLARCSERAK